MLRHLAVCICCLCPLLSALAADSIAPPSLPPEPLAVLDQAVANSREWLANADRAVLVFMQDIESDDGEETEHRVMQVDQRRPPAARAELLSVNGRPPDSRTLKRFRKQQEKRARREADGDGVVVTVSLTQFDTRGARLVGREGELLVFTVPNGARSILTDERQARMAEHLAMRVQVDPRPTAGPFLAIVELASEAPFKPGLIGKVNRFAAQWEFDLLEPGRLLVPRRIATDVEGRALFQDFNNRQQVAFKDYEIHPAPGSGEAGTAGRMP